VRAKGNGGSGLDTSRAQAQWLSTLTATAFLSHLVERSSVTSPFACSPPIHLYVPVLPIGQDIKSDIYSTPAPYASQTQPWSTDTHAHQRDQAHAEQGHLS